MASSRYYRRQYDLCLRLALLESDPQCALLLIRLAKELRAKANEAEASEADDAFDPALVYMLAEGAAAAESLDRHWTVLK